MTIKKPMKAPAMVPATAGGAAIASRLQLDTSAVASAHPANSKSTTFAAVAGLIALAVAGLLTYILWQHWDFLMRA